MTTNGFAVAPREHREDRFGGVGGEPAEGQKRLPRVDLAERPAELFGGKPDQVMVDLVGGERGLVGGAGRFGTGGGWPVAGCRLRALRSGDAAV